jgi:nucleoside-diphosphate-sugar epimerase
MTTGGAATRGPVLVTGATGFIGRRLVARLLKSGHRVRALVRRQPPTDWSGAAGLEIVAGDLADAAAVERAVAGASVVYHLGATMRGTAEDFERGTVRGTGHVIDAVLTDGAATLVYVSSLAVLHAAAADETQVITESWPLEPAPDARGHYTRSKLAAEVLVLDAVRQRRLRAVVLRPGEVVGAGATFLTPGVAQRVGRALVVLGDGETAVPLVAVEDLVDALMAAIDGPFDGTVVHVVDPRRVTQNDLVARYAAAAREAGSVVHVPRPVVTLAAFLAEVSCLAMGRQAPLTRYRVRSALASRTFDCRKAAEVLAWRPRVGVASALDDAVASLPA